MQAIAKRFYAWSQLKAQSRLAPLWLGIIFLLEVVLFLPMDMVLVLFCLAHPRHTYRYAIVATVASVCNATVGFILGWLAWDIISPYVLDHLVSSAFFYRLCTHYQEQQILAVFLGSFLPLPFKAITLSAGVCQLSLFPFLITVAVARLLRFFIIAQAVLLWGDTIQNFIGRHFNRLIFVVGAKVALALGLVWVMGS